MCFRTNPNSISCIEHGQSYGSFKKPNSWWWRIDSFGHNSVNFGSKFQKFITYSCRGRQGLSDDMHIAEKFEKNFFSKCSEFFLKILKKKFQKLSSDIYFYFSSSFRCTLNFEQLIQKWLRYETVTDRQTDTHRRTDIASETDHNAHHKLAPLQTSSSLHSLREWSYLESKQTFLTVKNELKKKYRCQEMTSRTHNDRFSNPLQFSQKLLGPWIEQIPVGGRWLFLGLKVHEKNACWMSLDELSIWIANFFYHYTYFWLDHSVDKQKMVSWNAKKNRHFCRLFTFTENMAVPKGGGGGLHFYANSCLQPPNMFWVLAILPVWPVNPKYIY